MNAFAESFTQKALEKNEVQKRKGNSDSAAQKGNPMKSHREGGVGNYITAHCLLLQPFRKLRYLAQVINRSYVRPQNKS